MRRSSARSRFAAALAALALLAAGCFGGGGGDGAGSTGAAESEAGPPQPGGVYHSTYTSDAPTIDPHKESSFNTHVTVGYTYSKLVDFRTGPDVPYASSELEGDLAESWEMSEDAMTWTFHLRPGVRFHDVAPVNGREFTSADVACTIDRIKTLPGQQLHQVSMIQAVETPDPATVVFRLTEPYVELDLNFAGHFMWMLPCEGTQGQFDLETQAIGTGPFLLSSWVRDKERIYTKNPTYYDEGKPYLDSIEVSFVPDQGAALAALRTGKIDALTGIADQAQVDSLLSSDPNLVVREELGLTPTLAYMNQAVEPFDDIRVRQAVSMAIDRESMMNALRPGDPGGELTGPVTPKLFGGLDPEEVGELEPYDPDQAKELLADAGFPDGFEVTMILTDGYGEDVVQEAQWVQEDLAAVGIEVELDVQDYATYFTESWEGKDFTMGYGLLTPMLSADEYLTSVWRSDGSRNNYNINDPELDAMIDEQRGILDEGEREQALGDIQRYIIENYSNPIFLYVYNSITVLAPYVHGYYPHPDYGSRHMKDVWLGADAPGRG